MYMASMQMAGALPLFMFVLFTQPVGLG